MLLVGIMPPFLSPGDRPGNERHRTRGWRCGTPHPHALRCCARNSPRAATRRPMRPESGPRLLFAANLLPIRAFGRRLTLAATSPWREPDGFWRGIELDRRIGTV